MKRLPGVDRGQWMGLRQPEQISAEMGEIAGEACQWEEGFTISRRQVLLCCEPGTIG